jgi:uncharacterized protein with ParB-like and HNH nuclease domain
MCRKTSALIREGKIFQIPDYQRGYAWEAKQWKDFVQDIDAPIDNKRIRKWVVGAMKFNNNRCFCSTTRLVNYMIEEKRL